MMRVAWGLYAVLGLLWVGMASRPPSGPGGPDEVAMMNMFQVTIGLLLMSVTAATGLAEERARGSLDVLLSTPMSTRSILAGKWWGTFRGVARIAIWPAATTFFLVLDGGYWRNYLTLLGLVLAYGAMITSLGLALATWVSRLGRAIALCVTAYVALVIGWPMLLIFGLGDRDPVILALILGDPLYGSAFLTMATSGGPLHLPGSPTAEDVFHYGVVWLGVHSGVAALLLWATLATFDRCLGRIPEDGTRPPPGRPGRSSRAPAKTLALLLSSDDEL
jgi:ABC-type Na+ efflux pump permease subunit